MLTARPTTYCGIEMRSRLEAQFAEFLDRSRFDWEYEPRAFGGRGARQYLPDFRLVNGRYTYYVELKGGPIEDWGALVERMAVIWQSDPESRLFIVNRLDDRTAGVVVFAYDQEDNRYDAVLAGFGLCRCGGVTIAYKSAPHIDVSEGNRCRHCTTHDYPVAFLDPVAWKQ